MRLEKEKKDWDGLGRIDPLWAILSWPDKRNRAWGIEEFFKTGETRVAAIMKSMQPLGLPLHRAAALDFGCGVGRVTQALCAYFESCICVDIAPSMIRLARKYKRHGEKCRYVLNDTDDLKRFERGSRLARHRRAEDAREGEAGRRFVPVSMPASR